MKKHKKKGVPNGVESEGAPTQKQMADPSFSGNGKPNYIDKEAESPVEKPHIDGADQSEPVYVANHKRYREFR